MGRFSEIHQTTTDRKWQIRCRQCQYLGPWVASLLYAAYLRGIQLHQEPRITLPSEPAALHAYCVYSGMAQAFGHGPPPSPDHPECETIPLEQFYTASWDRSNRIINLLRRHTQLSADSEDQVRICIQEVIQNIEDHSQSPIGGVMSARYFRQTNEVRVGIADRGVGIGTSLRQKHKDIPGAFAALNRVIQGGYSSHSRANNMGLGVSNLFALVRSAGGRIAVFSEDAYGHVHGGATPTVHGTTSGFPGTAVFFSLPI